MEFNDRIDRILDKTGVRLKPADYSYYKEAITHKSYINEVEPYGTDYQRLEFIGDAVLELAITDLIYRHTSLDEGNMSFLRQKLVKEDTLAAIANDIGLDEIVLIGCGEDRKRPSLLADVFEAFLGAVYLDMGFGAALEVVERLFLDLIIDYGNDITKIRDPKSLLYEYIQTDTRNTVKFVLIRDTLLPNNHHLFEVEVRIDDVIYGRGKGHSKSEAEQEAAKDALAKIART